MPRKNRHSCGSLRVKIGLVKDNANPHGPVPKLCPSRSNISKHFQTKLRSCTTCIATGSSCFLNNYARCARCPGIRDKAGMQSTLSSEKRKFRVKKRSDLWSEKGVRSAVTPTVAMISGIDDIKRFASLDVSNFVRDSACSKTFKNPVLTIT